MWTDHELSLAARSVGEEPTSQATGLYNRIMREALPEAGIGCIVIPRKERDGAARRCIQRGDFDALRELVPPTTYDYFTSPAAAPVIERIRCAADVAHY